ncbi:hypothetical protein WJX82_010561 [Trebouxia sp. C0006]
MTGLEGSVHTADNTQELAELFDATLKFTSVLKKKGVSQSTLTVAVRCRPLTRKERSSGCHLITRLVEDKVIIVMDPAAAGKPRLPIIRRSTDIKVPSREKRYVFDKAYDGNTDNRTLYNGVVKGLIAGVLLGLNTTVFAYGATGSGKTYTMVGTPTDPGIMVLSMSDIFAFMAKEPDKQWDVTCSYCEVYNELIFDLLQDNSPPLDLREDPEAGPTVAGLSKVKVDSVDTIFALLQEGNKRRKTEATDANAASSRSHAILEVTVCRSDKNHYRKQVYTGKLSLVDLAGSERASETNNVGRQLKDGANINRSLLALAECINALGKARKKGLVFVPFRNSKLTRLLKDGLCGNSRTAMIATVASSSVQYHHTVNTLKYADRAKEIKTHVRQNAGTVQEHIAQYQAIIDDLKEENDQLKRELNTLQGGEANPEDLPVATSNPAWAQQASSALAAATRERVELQRAIVEAEDSIVRAQAELDGLQEEQARMGELGVGITPLQAADLDRRKEKVAKLVKEGEMEKLRIHGLILQADAKQQQVQESIATRPRGGARDELISELIQSRLAVSRAQMNAEASVSEQMIEEQQEVIAWLWRILEHAGMTQAQAVELARRVGQGQGSRRVSMAGGDGRLPRRQGSWVEGPRRQSSGSGSRLGLRRQGSSGVISTRMAPMQLEQLLTGAYTAKRYSLWQSRQAVLNAQLTGPTGGSSNQLDTETAAADAIAALGPVLESLMGMKGLPSSSSLPLEDSSRGAHQGPRGSGREERTAKEDEVGEGSDKLSASPSYSASHKGSGLNQTDKASPANPYLARQTTNRPAPNPQPFSSRTPTIGTSEGNGSSSSQAPARTFLRSNRTLQHRQALLPSGSSASSDSSLLSQQSGVKFGRAARVGALGVAAGGPPAPQRGLQARPPRPPSGRVQKRTAAGGRPSSRPSSRGQAKQSTKEGTGNTKLRQLARNRAAQESRRRGE